MRRFLLCASVPVCALSIVSCSGSHGATKVSGGGAGGALASGGAEGSAGRDAAPSATGGSDSATSGAGGSDAGGNEAGANAGGTAGTGGGTTDGGDPLQAAATCTSGTTWNGFTKGLTMAPGQACITCHSQYPNAPQFTIAGTVYPTGHEPNGCDGADGTSGPFAGAVVILSDDSGKVLATLPVNSVGNFTSTTAIPQPFFAKVVLGTGERAMTISPPKGDCNSCHTQTGANGAPGRITLPAPSDRTP